MKRARTTATVKFIARSTGALRTLALPESEYTAAHPELVRVLSEYDFVGNRYSVPEAVYTILQTLSLGESLSDRAEHVLKVFLELELGWEHTFCPSCYVPTLDDERWEHEEERATYDPVTDLYTNDEGDAFRPGGGGGSGGHHSCIKCARTSELELIRGQSDRLITHPSDWLKRGIRPLEP